MEENYKPIAQPQRCLNPKIKEVVRKEVIKLLEVGIIYPISNSKWFTPVQVVPKKWGMKVVHNENDELIPTRTIMGWWMCIDYRKLNQATRKDHFPPHFMDQMLERSNRPRKNCIHLSLWIFSYRRMPFGLCNALATLQRCMLEIFGTWWKMYRSFHGWPFNIWFILLIMPTKSKQSFKRMWRNQHSA